MKLLHINSFFSYELRKERRKRMRRNQTGINTNNTNNKEMKNTQQQSTPSTIIRQADMNNKKRENRGKDEFAQWS
jgi:hypothetical protein